MSWYAPLLRHEHDPDIPHQPSRGLLIVSGLVMTGLIVLSAIVA